MKTQGVLWKIVDGILLLSVAGMLFTVLLQIATRLLGQSVPWTEEMTRNLFVLTVFMGLAVGFRRVEHARMTFFMKLMPRVIQEAQVHLYFLGGVVFFSVLAYRGFRMSLQQFLSGEMSPASGIPMFVVTAPITLGAVLSIVALVQTIYIDKRAREKLIQEEEEGVVGAEDLTSRGGPEDMNSDGKVDQ